SEMRRPSIWPSRGRLPLGHLGVHGGPRTALAQGCAGVRRRRLLLADRPARDRLAVAKFLADDRSKAPPCDRDEPRMLDERRLEGGVGNHGKEHRDLAWHRSALSAIGTP